MGPMTPTTARGKDILHKNNIVNFHEIIYNRHPNLSYWVSIMVSKSGQCSTFDYAELHVMLLYTGVGQVIMDGKIFTITKVWI